MPWSDGLDEATLGHAKLNGWQTDGNPEEIARAAVQAHLTAQNVLKAPPGEFLRSSDKDALYAALGAAKDPKEYVFDGIKFRDGTPADEGLVEALRGVSSKLRLSPAAASELAAAVVGWADAAEASEVGDKATKRTAEDIELRRSWGGNYDTFKGDADRAAALLGMTPQDVEALAGIKGYAATYEQLRTVSARLGESKFLTGDRGGANQFKPMSREEAAAKIEELKMDPAWVTRYLNVSDPGHKEAMAFMNHLQRIKVGMPV